MPVTRPRHSSCSYMVKPFKKKFRKHWADFDETLYEALQILALYILFKFNFDPGLTLTYSIGASILQLKTFIRENVTMRDSLKTSKFREFMSPAKIFFKKYGII